MNDDAEIVHEFLVESHENLDQLDRDLVALEREPGSRELLSSIFRTIHTIKGTSGFLAFNRLEALTHIGEHLLSRLRDGQQTMSPPVAEALLRMVDTVRQLLELVESTGSDAGGNVDVDPVVAELHALVEGDGGAHEEPATETEPVAEVVDEPVDEGSAEPVAEPVAEVVAEPVTEVVAEPVAEVLTEPVVDPAAPVVAEPVAEASAETAEPGTERRGVIDSSVRVDVDLLDSLVQLVGELVLTRNQILQQTESFGDVDLMRAAQRLNLVASELQESVMKTRMQPIGQVWAKMPRIVRDLAAQLGREVDLKMEGHETELDRTLLEALKGPLTHLVRNSMDHGIEPPDVRRAAGKPAQGTLSLRAYHESGQVVVEITDDGKGIDPVKIGNVGVSRGIVTRDQLSHMETRDILGLIFRPGFSTAEAVTNVSGRGVGMDVVRTNIEGIGGSVDIHSNVGAGTTCRVRIPLTLAIIPALLVGERGERYAIPQANLVELVRLEGEERRKNVEVLAGSPVLRLRGKLLPLVTLSDVLGTEPGDDDALNIVVLQADNVRFGLCVGEVHDTQEIVVKPIGRQLKDLNMYAGATIMGDGRVALIVDVAGIAEASNVADSVDHADEAKAAGSGDQTSLLVLEVSNQRQAALPLKALSRLEEFPFERIERSGSREVVQYRDGILPLVRLAPAIGLPDTAGDQERLSVVVHEQEGSLVGIVIDRVVDVVDTAVTLSDVGRRTGVLGSAVVRGQVTDLVDLDAVIAASGVGA